MKLTIKEIAKKANVSITTVSRVLNKNKEGVGDKTRKKVEQVIEEYGYRPNAVARSMVTKNTKTIALVIPDIRNPFFSDLAKSIEDTANQRGYSIFLCNVENHLDRIMKYLHLLIEKNVDGIIFSSTDSRHNVEVKSFLKQYSVPVIFTDRGINDTSFNGVFIDNKHAGYLATDHLLKMGHSKIGCITGSSLIWNSEERLDGYKLALDQAELLIDDALIIEGSYTMEGGYQAAKNLFTNHDDITAIFALNDLMAFGVYQAAQQLNVSVPEDVSVIGFDNISYNQVLTPSLTTIEQPVNAIGETSVDQLIKQIEQDVVLDASIFLKTRIITRHSVIEVNKEG